MLVDRPEAKPLHLQIRYLDEILRHNLAAQAVLAVGEELALPGWYPGAGCIAQSVWNVRHGYDPAVGIKDYDLVYFDAGDLSLEAENYVEHEVAGRLSDLAVIVDVKNQARVHLWYPNRFGRTIEPYHSTEEAIATWPTTASSVGVRRDRDGFIVCAPFGLADLFAMLVRPNKTIVSREVYLGKGFALDGSLAEIDDRPLVGISLLEVENPSIGRARHVLSRQLRASKQRNDAPIE